MSHSSSPNISGSIIGWVKNLKKGNLLSNDSVNEVTSDNDLNSQSESKSPSKSMPITILLPQLSQSQSSVHTNNNNNTNNNNHINQSSTSPPHQDFLRPLLHHKSRSTNNVNRVRSNSLNHSEKSSSLRQHRDSFLQQNPLVDQNSKYFGVPLEIANTIASTSVLNDSEYGQIPRIVAKCGVYLKKNGLGVEGIFRVGGSSKRVKELQLIFNTPPDFGKNLSWDGYNVHDAASIFRRYLNALPEPIIPLDMYESFRDPLRKRHRISNYFKHLSQKPTSYTSITSKNIVESSSNENDSQPLTEANIGRLNNSSNPQILNPPKIITTDTQGSSDNSPSGLSQPKFEQPELQSQPQPPITQSEGNIESSTEHLAIDKKLKHTKQKRKYEKVKNDVLSAIEEYKQLIDELPPASKQLLLYILDLLSMVRLEVEVNLMSSRNLAAIFQPSILSHPSHDMNPEEYALSQTVVEFLIQYFHYFLADSSFSLETGVQDYINNNHNENITTETKKENGTSPENEQDLLEVPNSQSQQKVKKRHHSKSLSSTPFEVDLVGYQNKSSKEPIVISKKEFEISDDDNEIDTTGGEDNDQH